jgi:hypothetical protein
MCGKEQISREAPAQPWQASRIGGMRQSISNLRQSVCGGGFGTD